MLPNLRFIILFWFWQLLLQIKFSVPRKHLRAVNNRSFAARKKEKKTTKVSVGFPHLLLMAPEKVKDHVVTKVTKTNEIIREYHNVSTTKNPKRRMHTIQHRRRRITWTCSLLVSIVALSSGINSLIARRP